MPVPLYFVDGNVGVGKQLPTKILDVVGDVAVTGTITSGGTPVGTLVLAAVGAVPNANGASASGMTLTLQPADGTNPGVLTAGAQTIGGAKTFSGAISASNLSGTNTGNVSLAAVGSSPNANGASLSSQALNLQPADATNPGVVTAGAQTFGGTKTFDVAPTLTTGVINSSVANSGSNFAFKLNSSNSLTGSTFLLALQNNTVDKVDIDKSGIIYCSGYSHISNNTAGVIFSGNNTLLRGHTSGALVALGDDTPQNYATFSTGGLDMSNQNAAKLTYSFTDNSASPGNTTINKISGRGAIANGAQTCVVSCDKVTANSIIQVHLETAAAGVGNVIVTAKTASTNFTVTSINGTGVATNTTANATFSFVVIN